MSSPWSKSRRSESSQEGFSWARSLRILAVQMLRSKQLNMLSRPERPICFARRKLRLARAWQTSGVAMVTWSRRLTIGCRVFQPLLKRSASNRKARSQSLAGTTSASMQAWRTTLTIRKCLAASYAKSIEGCIIKSQLQLPKPIMTEAHKQSHSFR